MNVKVLNEKEVAQAQRLAYQVLVVEQSWILQPDNPSHIHVENGRLRDRYDAVAVWFGALEEGEVVACCRVCQRLEQRFELEHYCALPAAIRQEPHAVELTRLVVRTDHRKGSTATALLRFAFQYVQEHGYQTLFATASFPMPGAYYARRFGMLRADEPFRYHPDDPSEAYLIYQSRARREQVLRHLDKLLHPNHGGAGDDRWPLHDGTVE